MNGVAAGPRHAVPVVMVGPVPPPLHGQAIADQLLFDGAYHRISLEAVGLHFSSDIGDVGRARLGKVATLFRSIVEVLRARRRSSARTLVYSLGAKGLAGIVRDTVLLLSIRPAFDRVILHVHTGGIDELVDRAPWGLRQLARRAYGATSAVIHLSPGRPERVFSTERWFFVPNGIEVPQAVDDPERLDSSGRRPGPARVLFLGNLYETKGPDVLLDAAERLIARDLDVEVVLAGDAPDAAYARHLAARLRSAPLAGVVRATGPLRGDDKWRALLDADVVCVPTFYEGEAFPLVIIEAMACARPVVASDWRSIDQLVDDGRTGFLVPPRDPSALADRLAELIIDPASARTMGTAGRRRYEEAFTADRFRARFEDVVAAVATP